MRPLSPPPETRTFARVASGSAAFSGGRVSGRRCACLPAGRRRSSPTGPPQPRRSVVHGARLAEQPRSLPLGRDGPNKHRGQRCPVYRALTCGLPCTAGRSSEARGAVRRTCCAATTDTRTSMTPRAASCWPDRGVRGERDGPDGGAPGWAAG